MNVSMSAARTNNITTVRATRPILLTSILLSRPRIKSISSRVKRKPTLAAIMYEAISNPP